VISLIIRLIDAAGWRRVRQIIRLIHDTRRYTAASSRRKGSAKPGP
jgi:hypothetical protein